MNPDPRAAARRYPSSDGLCLPADLLASSKVLENYNGVNDYIRFGKRELRLEGRRGQPGKCPAFRPGGCEIFTASGVFGATLTA